jgi:transcriptional regulator PpsR
MNLRSAPAAAPAHGEDRTTDARVSVLGGLSSATATRALAASSDLALIIDSAGVIRDVVIGNAELADCGIEFWVNRKWADTVQPENRIKIDELLAGAGDPARWRQVNHSTENGDLPMRYLAVRTGEDGGVVAIGRDMRAAAVFQQRLLRAQQSMERDSLRLRQLEARYRLLFDTAIEAIVVVDATTRRIIEANPRARLYGADPPR